MNYYILKKDPGPWSYSTFQKRIQPSLLIYSKKKYFVEQKQKQLFG